MLQHFLWHVLSLVDSSNGKPVGLLMNACEYVCVCVWSLCTAFKWNVASSILIVFPIMASFEFVHIFPKYFVNTKFIVYVFNVVFAPKKKY